MNVKKKGLGRLGLVLLLALAIVCSLLSGCGKTDNQDGGNAAEYAKGEISYPIETDEEITFWVWLNPVVAKSSPSFNETVFVQQLIERTGIKIKYIQPAVGQEEEKFNLLFSSGNIPDIVCHGWRSFPGGADAAISGEYIMSLNDYIEDYAPNYYKLLRDNSDMDKIAKSENNNYYNFGTVGTGVLAFGPLIREDWLETLDLPVPETIDDWYITLTKFKEAGAPSPLAYGAADTLYTIFMSAYDAALSGTSQPPKFIIENGAVKYGPMQPGYKDFVREMNKWYMEGLIDKNIASADGAAVNAKVLNDQTGASAGWIVSGLGAWMNAKQDDGAFSVIPTPYPVLTRGSKPKSMDADIRFADFAAISASSKHKEIAMRFMDYGFSEEGYMFHNFGEEGVTYNMVDGTPVYSDLIMKNPEGLSISEALGKYAHGWPGSFVSDVDGYLQQLSYRQQKDAVAVWSDTDRSSAMPPVTLSESDGVEYTNIMAEVETYVKEKTLSMICGVESLDTLDKMEAQLKAMNIDRAIEIQQAALEKYNAK